ncbi:MAG: radical SAM protein [bacterium]
MTVTTDKKPDIKINPSYHEMRPASGGMYPWEKAYSEEYWEYRRKWAENPRNFIVERFPIHLDIETTRVCDLRCPHCPRTQALEAGTLGPFGHMPFDLFKKIIDEGGEKGLCSVKFNYLGEPLLHPKCAEMVRYAKEKGVLDVMFNTNGTTLTEKKAIELIEAGLDKIIFSFDAHDRELYEKLRAGANYDEVVENILRFQRIRNEKGKLFPVTRVSMVRMKDNHHDYENFVKFWKDKVDLVSTVDYQNPLGHDRVDRTSSEQEDTFFACSQLWQRLFVWWDGSVHLCCGDYEGAIKLGNAKEKTIEEIWLGPTLNRIRRLHQTGEYRAISICARCNVNRMKPGGGLFVKGSEYK